ncbi:hypothetical protein DPMN_124920 [Dreissena polymorpha]|uniref:Uncharacterized protein n=1 Tax=Dreissena polymorpha TaxID=45954 RepID=A0A9D4GX77_DREPO|nr:hypothetical protein DPMN_124920 [Dreissena polymorpha]
MSGRTAPSSKAADGSCTHYCVDAMDRKHIATHVLGVVFPRITPSGVYIPQLL